MPSKRLYLRGYRYGITASGEGHHPSKGRYNLQAKAVAKSKEEAERVKSRLLKQRGVTTVRIRRLR
jgi:hypothetical protein